MTTKSRLIDLRSRFEGPPEPVTKERVQSAVDAPAPTVSAAAREAARKSAQQTQAKAEAPQRRRIAPAIEPGDSDELRSLKRTAQAKELEIQALVTKFQTLEERLARLTAQFDAAQYAPVVATAAGGSRVKSTEYVPGAQAARETVQAAEASKRAGSTGASTSGTSLEAILAAARGGSTTRTNAPVKFSKIMRDFK